MPCLNPLTIKNPRYLPSKKNGYNPPIPIDNRLYYLQVPCGKCIECRRRRASDWRFRLHNEYRYNPQSRFYFVTLTLSDDGLKRLLSQVDFEDGIFSYKILVIKAVRLFLERYRKKYGRSLRHLFVSELGEENGRIHIHGIIVAPNTKMKFHHFRKGIPVYRSPEFDNLWNYGFTYIEGCAERCISYVLKYIMKKDEKHPDFVSTLLVSPGLGKEYVNKCGSWHRSGEFKWFCVSSSGWKIAMPRYYKEKIFDERERLMRSLMLLDDPPPPVFHGREFKDIVEYSRFLVNYFAKTLRLGLVY